MANASRQVGRPRSFDEDQVLDRALEVFWTRGAASTTTRVLEAELSMTQSSIYNAFGTKRQLLDRALDRYMERIDAEMVAPLDVAGAGPETLLAFLDDLVAWITHDARPGCLMLNLLAEQGTRDHALVSRARLYRDRLRGAFAAALSGLDPANAASRAELVLAGVMGLNIAARGGAARAEIDALADALRSQISTWAN